MAWIPAAIAGGAALAGALDTNSQNKGIAEDNRTFQANMSNTSYQRAVKDMQAAGLNPMLAYSQGGASTPAGSTATMINAIGEGANSAYSGYSRSKEAELIDAQVHKVEADAQVSKNQAALIAAQIPKVQADTHLSVSSAAHVEQLAKQSSQYTENLKAELKNIPLSGNQIEAVTRKVQAEIPVLTASERNIRAVTAKVVKETANLDLTADQIKALTRNISAETRKRNLDYVMGVTSDLPASEAMGKYWRGEWGQDVAPYLSDLGKLTNSAAAIRRAVR